MLNISGMSVAELQSLMERGELTSRALTLWYLERIASLDRNKLNSVLEISPDALFWADQMDMLRAKGEVRSLLHGMPVLLKDNINTGDKLHTSVGSLALADHYAPADSHIVTRLRAAGAVILGKANMTEFANFLSDNMPGGYSSRGGQVICPHNPKIHPSGSSSGSAVAVQAELCAVAVGTETSGSIISPSWRQGIVGLKPTLGLVSREGILPISNTLDTAGPMARSVADVAALLTVLAGEDPADPATCRIPEAKDYTHSLQPGALSGMCIGICRVNEGNLTEIEAKTTNSLIDLLKKKGAQCLELSELAPDADLSPTKAGLPIMTHEFEASLDAYLGRYGGGKEVSTMRDILSYNQLHRESCLKYGQTRMEASAASDMRDPAYFEAMSERERLIELLTSLYQEHQLDLILFMHPTNIAPIAGFPAMTLPLGVFNEEHLPVGCYLMADRFREDTLIGAGYDLENALKNFSESMQ